MPQCKQVRSANPSSSSLITSQTDRYFWAKNFSQGEPKQTCKIEIEAAARGIETWSERQQFLNTVYERFFQGFAVKKADTLGIVYTPQEIVEFMVASVDEVLRREFDKSLATPSAKILDPCVGTGNFIVNIIKHIASSSRSALREKYEIDPTWGQPHREGYQGGGDCYQNDSKCLYIDYFEL